MDIAKACETLKKRTSLRSFIAWTSISIEKIVLPAFALPIACDYILVVPCKVLMMMLYTLLVLGSLTAAMKL